MRCYSIGTFIDINGINPYGKEDNYLQIILDSNPAIYRLSDLINKTGTYTFSIWCKSEQNCNIEFNILGTSMIVSVNNNWQKFSKTVEVSDLNTPYIDIIPDSNTTTYYYESYLVTGEIDTSWTPAPEDIDESIATLSSNISKLEITADSIKQMVEKNYVTKDEAGNLISESKTSIINQTADMIESSVVDNITGENSYVNQKVNSITQSIEDIKGNVSEIKQTAENINQKIENAEGDISSLQQSADGFNQRVETIEGNISSINQDVSSITQRIVDAEGNISDIEQTAEGLQSQITDNKNNIATLEQSADEFKITVSKTYSNKADSVKSTVEQFYQSTSPTSLVNGSWSTTQPTWKNGTYIWRRTLVTYGDGHTSYTPSSNGVCITGNTGSKGDKGDTGKGIKSTEITYQAGTSGTTPPSGTWSSSIPTVDNGKYLWSKTTITYTDDTTSTSYTASYISIDGETGASGKGINKIEQEYYLSSSKTTQTGGSWVTSMPQWSKGKYLWTRYKITYENPTSIAYTSPICDSSWEAANDVANDLKENYYTKIETDAAIKVASDSITSTVSTSISNEINNIEIGGTNLLVDSDTSSLSKVSGLYDKRFSSTINDADITASFIALEDSPCLSKNGIQINVINPSSEESGSWLVFYDHTEEYPLGIKFKDGDKYTLSCYARSASGSPKLNIGLFNKTNFGYQVVTENWEKYYLCFTATADMNSEDAWAIFGCDSTIIGSIQITGFKLERGNKATDWTPAPEDMATGEEVENAQASADHANSIANSTESRITVAESTIQQLSDSISSLVIDENGNSMMTQTSTGWQFNMGDISSQLSDAKNQLNNLSGKVDQANGLIQNVNDLANDLSEKTAYINMTTDSSGNPCIELGRSSSNFKVRITNTSIDFMEGSSRLAYFTNQSLYIGKAIIRDELQIGEGSGFVWKRRSNGNMGLRWVGGN